MKTHPAPTAREVVNADRLPWGTIPTSTRITPTFDVDAAWNRVILRVVAGLLFTAAFMVGVAVGLAIRMT